MNEVNVVKINENYTVGSIGKFESLNEYSYLHTAINRPINGKVFLGEKLNMTGSEISFQVLKAGEEIPFDHMHRENEEVYIVIKGSGEFIIDGETTEVSEGSIITIRPKAKRRWRNNSDKDLIIMVTQAVYKSLNNFNVTDGYI